MAVRIAWDDIETRTAVKAAGAIWRPRHRQWEVECRTVRRLKLQNKVVREEKQNLGRNDTI